MNQKKYFGVMLDMSRNAVMKIEQLEKFVDTISAFGYNMIQLYTEDTYEVNKEPYFGYLRGRYTKEELKKLDIYCQKKGIELIPCVQTLAHLGSIFRWKNYNKINDVNDILLAKDQKTYQLIDNIFATLRECFSSDNVNIGMDEAHMLGLGKYLDMHGFSNRFDILKNHLQKVIEIASKYNFKPMMWSDMFFRLANHGEYYGTDVKITDDIKATAPKEVSLVYWDYYHQKKSIYNEMIKSHQQFDNNIWFAGGAWSWVGFAPGNGYSLKTMKPAMQACRQNDINNIFITLWGDNGKECSYFSLLPALFAIKQIYDGNESMLSIKEKFKEITGEDYDWMCALDLPNLVNVPSNPCKHMLYSDPFNGFLDTTVKEEVNKEYKKTSRRLMRYSKDSKYGYIFESLGKLCDLLSVKYDLGWRTRKLYQQKNIEGLKELISDYKKAEIKLEKFYIAFKNLWFLENKPHGFDVHDIRLGGLSRRLRSCRERLELFTNGEINDIPELEEQLLDFFGQEEEYSKLTPCFNDWIKNSTVNVL